MIGLAASWLWLASGRIAGISGILGSLVLGPSERAWRAWFLGGLLVGGLVSLFLWPKAFAVPSPRSLGVIALAGVLVGVGTRIGNGCTSGHGVCGISRARPRSIVATMTFIGTGMLTVALIGASS
jgi:uncharacterized protein